MVKQKVIETEQVEQSKLTSGVIKNSKHSYCSLPPVPDRVFKPEVNVNRASLIRRNDKKWVNGTILHYFFFDKASDGSLVYLSDGTTKFEKWTTNEAEKNVVRSAFNIWKKIGIGLEFKEVESRDEAEIRIGFMRGDGAWSFIGRDLLDIGRDERTMNFGWDLTQPSSETDTAIHEIGHTLGFPHEHQNPNAGIIWDEEAVYTSLAQPPNRWSRAKTYYNIIRKIDPDLVQGSNWDPNSIMHYPFEPGLIKLPEQFSNNGLYPNPGLSPRDKSWVKALYPPLKNEDYQKLKLFECALLSIEPGEQKNFIIEPNLTRYYNIQTFGESDTVMVLFEDAEDELQYRTADDDSGEDYNAKIRLKLLKKHRYILRVRLYYRDRSGETGLLMW
jgi:hypothetical protein